MRTESGFRAGVVTLFPEMFTALTESGVSGRASRDGRLQLNYANPRDWSAGRGGRVDDHAYGGGPGMVMQAEPLSCAVASLKERLGQATPVMAMMPTGKPLTQQAVATMASLPGVIVVAGRYEGIDERFIQQNVDACWSLGDYVLSGGELAAMVLLDAVTRLLPGVLGSAESIQDESFSTGLLEYPHYTRPALWREMAVPDVLLSGDHQAIANWRDQQAQTRTRQHRPDLWQRFQAMQSE